MGDYVHSKQARFDKSHVSCGMVEVHHLPNQTVTQTIFAIATHLYHKANGRPAAFVQFSDVVDQQDSRGAILAAGIKKLDCGDLLDTGKAINPRTGNTIVVWIWRVDHEKFRKWYTEEYANRIEEN